jgi:8-oxo-dGTP pyrophosphatase MutT (NUDIX family)
MTEFELIRQQLGERLTPPRALLIESDRIPQAAVTLLLHEEDEAAQILIIKRAERPGDHWSGHLALPGGRVDPSKDDNLLATATRETYEEIGVNLVDGGCFIGQLPVIAPSNPRLPRIEITPFVALAPINFTIRLNREVDSVFWVPFNRLKREGRSSEYRLSFGEVVKRWPAYPSQAGPIWGITERILTNFISLID